jgi:hypothetical protein
MVLSIHHECKGNRPWDTRAKGDCPLVHALQTSDFRFLTSVFHVGRWSLV